MSHSYALPTTVDQADSPSSEKNATAPTGTIKQRLWQTLKARSALSSPASPSQKDGGAVHRSATNTSSSRHKKKRWWHIHLFRGMYNDVRRRLPWYWSDFRDAWDYRVVPATVYMYFANILPALAFSLDMFDRTNHSFGVNEVLLSSVIGAGVFSLFGAQPLTIVGVTGPITVFNYTVYDLMVPTGTNYFAFMAVVGLWAMVMHWVLAITNSCNGLKYVTRFSCDTFGFYVACIYLQKGVQVLTRQFSYEGMNTPVAGYLSIMVSLLVLMVAYGTGILGGSALFQRYVRKFIEDYGTPLTIVFFTGFVHFGKMDGVSLQVLPTGKSFTPTADREWFVDFWNISAADVGIAFPFALVLTILFWFDHNVSSLIAQGTEFPLKKPAGFHWDIFLLGITTGVTGLIGCPFPNGLIPQAPFHTAALCSTRLVADPKDPTKTERITDGVVEQRVSNLAQGLLTLGTMSGPLLIVVGLIPQGVLAGLFFVMGVQALQANGITQKILYLARDRHLSKGDPLHTIQRQHMIWIFVGIELVGFGITFAITQTLAAIGFPVVILLLIPVRAFLLPKWFTAEELGALDAPTASPFTMESVGGQSGFESDSENELPLGAANTAPQSTRQSADRRSMQRQSVERRSVQRYSVERHPPPPESEDDYGSDSSSSKSSKKERPRGSRRPSASGSDVTAVGDASDSGDMV